ncbi:hypothetical protein SAY86_022548 [Trapa natans]|uniref:Uncharacterized protein n=1 Tax=Trapa natans TaxID=22666 RepID=A0AAN7M5S4_TRANT|nr:hypothetical protein SAY86_022548 [Trapa natans]
MVPNPKVKAAYVAMRSLGISEDKVKPVLKKLLRLYDKNWELIEEENYRVLADAIFEYDDNKAADEKRKNHNEEEEEPIMPGLQRPLKRPRHRNQENDLIASPCNLDLRTGGPVLIRPKQEEEFLPQLIPNERNKGKVPIMSKGLSINEMAYQSQRKDKGVIGRLSNGFHQKEITSESNTFHFPKDKHLVSNQLDLIKPKDEPFIGEVPLEGILPEPSSRRASIGRMKITSDVPASLHLHGRNRETSLLASQTENHGCEPAHVPLESFTNLEIASSSLGEVRLTLNCNSNLGRPGYHLPSLDTVLKTMEDKCLKSYKILDPNFSVMRLMRDMCQCFVELGNECNDQEDKTTDMGQKLDVLLKPVLENTPNGGFDTQNLHVPFITPDHFHESSQGVEKAVTKGCARNVERTEFVHNFSTGLHGSISPCFQATSYVQHVPLKGDDVTNGEEMAKISWINEIDDQVPPSFYYTPENVVFEGASVRFTLSQINDTTCCPSCWFDCLPSSVPCACACANGGEFVYSVRGLIKESFLDECIAAVHEPTRRSYFYCQECPLERLKGGAPKACNGHLKRKFIKECWRKCGCNRCCGNRVVQRGISCSLQVFMTSEGKGWGLRSLDILPKGAFVCEYIGEILTNLEVHKRNMNATEGGKMYQVILDSNWDTTSLKDDEALCLDATYYANVSRFINHRCYDANLIEIPVEVESPKRHYYHFALFTTRAVQALEELTWDYGINFEGDTLSDTFQCLCGSKFCRNRKTSERFSWHRSEHGGLKM